MKTITREILLLAFFLLSLQAAFGGNTLSIADASVSVKETATITINMQNDSAIVGFQVDIPIPSQLTYVPGSVALNASRITDHVVSASLLSDGKLRIICHSPANAAFKGNSGALVSFRLKAKTFPGNYTLAFSTDILGNIHSENILTGTQSGTLTVLGPDIALSASVVDFGRVPLHSDMDRYVTVFNRGNQDLNVQKITSTSPYFSVVGNTAFTLAASASKSLHLRFNSVVKNTYQDTLLIFSNDADEGQLPVQVKAVAFAVNELHTGNMSAFSGHYDTLSFTLNNMEPITGIQFDLRLPDPLQFMPDSAFLSSRKTNHVVSASKIDKHTLRVVAYSTDNQPFNGNDGTVITLGFHVDGRGGYYGLNISNVILGDTTGQNEISAYTNGSLRVAAADISAAQSVNFGNISILDTASQNITVANYGNDTLKISAAQFSSSAFFTTQTFPLLVLPSQQAYLPVSFHQATEGNASETLQLFSNDPDESPFTIQLSGYAFTPNYLYIKDSTYNRKDTIWVDILTDNLQPFTGFQFDLHYPDGLTCLAQKAKLGARAANHALQVSEIDNNEIRVIAYSLSGTNVTGQSGPVVHIPFLAGNGASGTIPLNISNAIMGTSQSKDVLWKARGGTIYLTELPGSANSIHGPDSVCRGENNVIYFVDSIPRADEIIWTLAPSTAGNIQGSGRTITLNWDSAFVGTAYLKVYGKNNLGTGPTDSVKIQSVPPPTANAGDNDTICETKTFTLQGTASNQKSVLWKTSGDGSFNNAALLNATYTPGTNDKKNGNVTLTLTAKALLPCGTDASDNMVLYIQLQPTVDAGVNDTIYRDNTYTLSGKAANQKSVLWTTSGDGTFDNASSLTAVYTPGSSDKQNKSVVLTLTAYGQPPCDGNVSDNMVLTLVDEPLPVVNAGKDDSICRGGSYTLSATASQYQSLKWSTSGDGSFDNVSTLNATYTPGDNDKSSGSVTLTLTAHAADGGIASDAMTLTILSPLQKPDVPQGPTSIMLGSVDTSNYTIPEVQNASSYVWHLYPDGAGTISGTGTTGTVTWNTPFTGTKAFVQVTASNKYCAPATSDSLVVTLSPVGISHKEKENSIVVAPNPTRGKFTLTLNVTKDYRLTVVNSTGQVVLQKKLKAESGQRKFTLDLGYFPAGIYYLRLVSERKVIIKKLMLNKTF